MAPPARARRVGARVVDAVVLAWLVSVGVVEVAGRWLGGDPFAAQLAGAASRTLVVTATLAGLVALEVVPVALWGRSPGKALLGLRVAKSHDHAAPPGMAAAVLRAGALFGPLAIPFGGPALTVAVAASALVLPGGRGVHDLIAGTVVVRSPLEQRARRRRYPRRAIDALPLPEVAKITLVEVGLPGEVPGWFEADPRMAVYDDRFYSLGADPDGLVLCVVAPAGEVVAIDPAGGPVWPAGSSLPAFVEVLDALAAEPGRLAAHLGAVDPDLAQDPRSWWAQRSAR